MFVGFSVHVDCDRLWQYRHDRAHTLVVCRRYSVHRTHEFSRSSELSMLSSKTSALDLASSELFIGHRIRVLSGSLIIPLIGCTSSLFNSTLTCVFTGLFMKFGSFTYLSTHKWLAITVLSIHVGVDILFSATMVYQLLHKQTAYKASALILHLSFLY